MEKSILDVLESMNATLYATNKLVILTALLVVVQTIAATTGLYLIARILHRMEKGEN